MLLLLLLGPDRLLHPLDVGLEILEAEQRTRFGIPAGGQHADAEAHQTQEEKQAGARQREPWSDIGDATGDDKITANKNSHPSEGRESCEHSNPASHPIGHVARNGFLPRRP